MSRYRKKPRTSRPARLTAGIVTALTMSGAALVAIASPAAADHENLPVETATVVTECGGLEVTVSRTEETPEEFVAHLIVRNADNHSETWGGHLTVEDESVTVTHGPKAQAEVRYEYAIGYSAPPPVFWDQTEWHEVTAEGCPIDQAIVSVNNMSSQGLFDIDSSWLVADPDSEINITLDSDPVTGTYELYPGGPEVETFGQDTYTFGHRYFGQFDPHEQVTGTYQVIVGDVEGEVVDFVVEPYPVPFPETPEAVDEMADTQGYLVIPDQNFPSAGDTLSLLWEVDGEAVDPGQLTVEPGTYNVSVSLPGSFPWPYTYTGPFEWELTVNPPPGDPSDPGDPGGPGDPGDDSKEEKKEAKEADKAEKKEAKEADKAEKKEAKGKAASEDSGGVENEPAPEPTPEPQSAVAAATEDDEEEADEPELDSDPEDDSEEDDNN